MNKRLVTLFSTFAVLFTLFFSALSFKEAYAADMSLNKTSVSLHTGESCVLKVKNLSQKYTVTWNVKDKKVASVSKKGKVTGLSEGNTSVYAKIYDKNKKLKITLTASISVDSVILKYASTKKELISALNEKKADIIALNPSKETSFVIPEGSFNTKIQVLTENKIDINITNGAFIKTVVLKKAGKQTFNIKGTLAELYINAAGSKVAVKTSGKKGELTSMYLSAPSSLSVNADGNGGDIAVYATAKSEINVKGNTSKNITLSLWKDAAYSVITAFRKIKLYADTEISVTLKSDAASSEISTLNYTVPVEIRNDTSEAAKIITPSGIKTVEAGKTGTVSGKKAS